MAKDHRSFTAKNAKNAKSIAKTIAHLTHRTIATEKPQIAQMDADFVASSQFNAEAQRR